MAEVVEGPWKDFVFRMARSDDLQKILEHLRNNFYKDEPLCKHLGCDDEEAEDFDSCVLGALADNLSFIAVHSPTNKIACVRITTLVKKDDHSELPAFKSQKSATIINFLNKATDVAEVFEKYPDIDQYADFFMASVDSEYRGQGLATEMYNRALKLFKARGITLCKSVLTSPFTRKACANLGFTEIARLHTTDYKDNQGNPYFPNAGPDEVITVAVLKV